MPAKIDISGQLRLRQQLQLLQLSPSQRRRLGGIMARKVRTYSRKRLRAQRGLDGQAWERRKGGKRKMLRGLSKRLRTKSDNEGGLVHFADLTTGRIAYAHQHGIPEEWTGQKAEKVYGKPDYSAPATRRQARALKQEGYVVRLPGGRRKKPTMRWITENLTLGQAGLILQTLRDEPRKNRWVIELPERSFLGVESGEVEELANTIFDDTIQRIKRA